MAKVKVLKEVEIEARFGVGDTAYYFSGFREGIKKGEISRTEYTWTSNTLTYFIITDSISCRESNFEEHELFPTFAECQTHYMQKLAEIKEPV